MRETRRELLRRAAIFMLVTVAAIPIAAQEDVGWPREFTAPGGARVVIFQPQVDALEGDRLTGRAAVAVTLADEDERVFGAVWFDARILTDRDTRTVAILEVEIPRVHFADATDEDQETLTDLLETEVPRMDLDISLDRMLTSLGVSETRRSAAEGLNNEPPEILFATTPTVLVFIDGEPVLQEIEGTNLRHVGQLSVRHRQRPRDRAFLSARRTRHLVPGERCARPLADSPASTRDDHPVHPRGGNGGGPWSFVAPDELPESFLAIEADGDMAHLRASVAGTEEAEESRLGGSDSSDCSDPARRHHRRGVRRPASE